MKEVKKCSISGVAFTLDADAYETLGQYLASLKQTYGSSDEGREIVADIEARIAELILSHQDNTSVVEKPLIREIIAQMGSAEDIRDGGEEPAPGPRIPRRLYRDTENAKLGGVCAGIGKYFDIDPVWVRLGLFLPLLLTLFGWVPLMRWTGPMMGNLFGIFFVCYLIMWFAVPPARTARQKLEMNGERITARSIGDATAVASDPDSTAKPVVARVVYTFGQVVLILLKVIAGLVVFGLILLACALIIALFALIVGGEGNMALFCNAASVWVGSFGVVAVLIPTILLIYVLMCLIASRKPSGKTVLVTFIVWFLTIVALCTVAIRGRFWENIGRDHYEIEWPLGDEDEFMDDGAAAAQIRIDGRNGLRLSVPDRVDMRIDDHSASLRVAAGNPDRALLPDSSALETAAAEGDDGVDRKSYRVIRQTTETVRR